MAFNLDVPLAFHILNGFFESQSYVKGAQASADDKTVFGALNEGPDPATYPHLARWYSHIAATQGLTEKTYASKDEEDFNLFGSDDEDDEENEKLKQQRVADYNAKKSKKPAVIAKSYVTMQVKTWDDTIDILEVEKLVRSVTPDGLLWGTSKFVEVAFGIKLLQINCVVEDDKVSLEDLSDKLTGQDAPDDEQSKFRDLIQSVDVLAMSKI